jgi:hypothetical protein
MIEFGLTGADIVQAMWLGNRGLELPEPHAQASMLHVQDSQLFLMLDAGLEIMRQWDKIEMG